MRHSLVQIESFQVAGLPIRTNNATEQTPNGKIFALWSDFFAQDLFGIEERIQGSPVYGVYTHYESDHTSDFDVIAGVKVTAAPTTHLQTVTINAGDYLVFETHGEMPQRIIEGWMAVWQYFEGDDVPYQRLYTTDFEQMINENDIKIFIAVKAK
jgi:predicted transcriptional regulator YdeE